MQKWLSQEWDGFCSFSITVSSRYIHSGLFKVYNHNFSFWKCRHKSSFKFLNVIFFRAGLFKHLFFSMTALGEIRKDVHALWNSWWPCLIHWLLSIVKVAGLVPVELYLLWGEPFMEERKFYYTSLRTLWLGLKAGSMTQFLNQFSNIF